jgi:hypothetical protein
LALADIHSTARELKEILRAEKLDKNGKMFSDGGKP